ncbi:RDD family protein [Pseudomonas lundensis]|uniref:RDD family protein n=1 Tax=Pseudomonas lundensis TaxID=86185 RepID=A0ABX4GRI6_9PSED|nr:MULTISPECIES: RDD family protein [Pseudomonas]NMZ54676.1 RDD family protein [Pseudomonas lundensis]NNA13400.1 RDD family protein [Pseudomonas lundensis]OZY27388.1 RDD family protein [Pseudomonas lundensis]OZY35971.1 RDD family protein [Pseudomonas lundensis]OZY56055.1 RDD family protein [Pseudomonas lundensis]
MSKQPLSPQGAFPAAGLGRRLAAMFYDFLLCTALMIVTTFLYKLIMMAFIGEAKMRALSEAGALDGDPLLSTLLFFVLFGFFAKFWTHSGQTLGMQVWGVRVQNADGTAISLWQALLRFIVSIGSWLCFGLGFFWSLIDKQKRTWHDMYSNTQLVRIPKQKKK